MLEKLKLIFWYLTNVKYSPQLIILFFHYLTKQRTKPNKELYKWFDKYNISETDFFAKLNFKRIDFYTEYKKIILRGNEIENKNKIKLGGGSKHLGLIHNLVRYINPSIVLETGVAYGWSSLAILTAFNNNNKQLISIDSKYPLIDDYSQIRGSVVINKSNAIV